MTTSVTITATNPGAGSETTITFDGTTNLMNTLIAYNMANPTIPLGFVGDGSQIPVAGQQAAVLVTILTNPYILTICGTELDLSCLASTPYVLKISEEGVTVDAATIAIDFVGSCVTATQTAPGYVQVQFDCNQPGLMPVDNTVFVMKNGSDTT